MYLTLWLTLIIGALSQLCCAGYSASCFKYGLIKEIPGDSCKDIYDRNMYSRKNSGYYYVNTTVDGIKQVYCDMDLECGGYKGGWMRIAELDTTKGDSCPGDWINDAVHSSLCTGKNKQAGCYSATFTTSNTSYSKICGQVRGYQKGSPDAFYPHAFAHNSTTGNIPSYIYSPSVYSKTVNGVYVDGISITLGKYRKHVWTYAAGLSDDHDYRHENCPCASISVSVSPTFVGNNYYCESGNTGSFDIKTLYKDDALWDGKQCLPGNSCCNVVGQPWFYRQLPTSEYEDLEVRICKDQHYDDEAIMIEKLQLFIQ